MAEELGFTVNLKHKKINISNPRVSAKPCRSVQLVEFKIGFYFAFLLYSISL